MSWLESEEAMCGIVGMVSKRKMNDQVLKRATSLLSHRGPDDEGILNLSRGGINVGLGHRRLSIIDLSKAGHQPMPNEDRTIWLVQNGEIYNFGELRDLLAKRGHSFRSKTDCEVLLHLYEEKREGMLDDLNGIYAFAIWDDREKTLFLARDRLGVKPLYYCFLKDGMAFASEIKSLLMIPEAKSALSMEGLASFLTFLWIPDPLTAFEGIYKLPPAHYLIFRDGKAKIREYWNVEWDHLSETDEDILSGEIAQKLDDVVRRQMVSDVPIGLCLSGGIDSTTILHFMKKASSERVRTFSVGFSSEDRRYEIVPDDLRYARMIAEEFDTDHQEIVIEPEIVSLLPKVVWHVDDLVADTAAFTTYLISRAARHRVKVLLAGVGGDEVFGGYPRQRAVKIAQMYDKLPKSFRSWAVNRLPGSHPGRFLPLFRGLKKLERSASFEPKSRYIGYFSYYTRDELLDISSNGLKDALLYFDPWGAPYSYFDKVKDADFLNQMLYVDMKGFLPCLNLTYTDRMSMAASVEVRVPFLDQELVEFGCQIPPGCKIRGLTSKYILRKAMSPHLPREIIKRRKAGFGAPVRAWVMRDSKELIGDLLSEEMIKKRGFFEPRAVQKLIDDNLSGRKDNSLRIWALLTLEVWLETFMDREPVGPIE